MRHTAEVWLLIVFAVLAANLPFVNERLFVLGPRRLPAKTMGWRLLEWLLLAGLTFGLGVLIESHIGRHQPQRWEFFAAGLCLFATFAFPGFAWRYLRRGRPHD